jgi:serine/threonine-protein kinase
MVTGHAPFFGVNTTAVAFAHVNTPPPSPRAERRDLPEQMEPVLLRQLAKAPDERFPTARAFVDALERALSEPLHEAGLTLAGGLAPIDPVSETMLAPLADDWSPLSRVAPRPPDGPARPPRPGDRPTVAMPIPGPNGSSNGRSWLVVLVAALVLLILGGYGLFAWGGHQIEPGGAPATHEPVGTLAPAPTASPPAEARAALWAGDFARAVDLLFEAELKQAQALLQNEPQAHSGRRQVRIAGLR